MNFLRFTSSASLCNSISRHFSSRTRLPKLRKIPYHQRSQAILQAQKALIDYLHATRSLPFAHAEQISKNSPFSLYDIISRVEFSPSNFSKNINKFLRYHPINEFEFFFESIGIDPSEIYRFLPSYQFFLNEEKIILNAALALYGFGFPWNKLGILYKEEISVFGKNPEVLIAQLCGFKVFGFDNVSIAGICLAFPFVLSENGDLRADIDALLDVLKRVFLDFDLKTSLEGNVDAWYDACRKIRVFYDLGCEKGRLRELMGKRMKVFLEHSEDVLVQKVEFFLRLDAMKEEVGLLLLHYPEILKFDLEGPMFSVLEFLKRVGLSDEELNSISVKYPYVLGRNRLRNLPHMMRALDLHNWFFNKIVDGNYLLLANFDISNPDVDMEKDFKDSLERIRLMKNHIHEMGKLNFLHEIGYGENLSTIKVLSNLHGSRNELQKRFDCLLQLGIEFHKLCKFVSVRSKILNQNPYVLEQKVKFLQNDIGLSLQSLDVFPAYLWYDLENRIKPRFRIHMWLKEKGLMTKQYSIATILATSEKKFIARLLHIHPAAPKQWLECFSPGKYNESLQET